MRVETAELPGDDDLMVRAAQDDREAFRLLVERWQEQVYAFLERMMGSREEALDLSQETFLRVYTQASRYRPQGQFRSWLFRIAGNLARSGLRRRRIVRWVRFETPLHDRSTLAATPDSGLARAETRADVRRALAALPERQRQAVLLRHYAELSHREIAQSMGTTVPAVESLLQRAMVTLRQRLADEMSEA
jgi:RNA polymerase sigma-70 factor (ECF subfamily)